MKALVHPAFDDDLRQYAREYAKVYQALGRRFEKEAREALISIKNGPNHAGHPIQGHKTSIRNIRRRNLASFPFFMLYSSFDDVIFIASLIAGRTDPLTWFTRIQNWPPARRH
jgi:hypothetical protein